MKYYVVRKSCLNYLILRLSVILQDLGVRARMGEAWLYVYYECKAILPPSFPSAVSPVVPRIPYLCSIYDS
jgi:hypothetical protein